MTGKLLRVGTRDSRLALAQTELIVELLRARNPALEFHTVCVKTHGDKVRNVAIADLGVRGVFVKELEDALLSGEVDLVAHSLKDLPTELPVGLTLAAILDRQDARDVLVSRSGRKLMELPSGSKVATSSRRRAAQVRALRQDLQFVDIRGNITTRLRKLDEGSCDAIILAAAGLKRLGLEGRIVEYFATSSLTPAVGQGALAVEVRSGDEAVLNCVKAIDNQRVRAQVTAERAFLAELGGGCSVPIGAFCTIIAKDSLRLEACIASLDGITCLRDQAEGAVAEAEALGKGLAQRMIDQGAKLILDKLLSPSLNSVSPP